MVKSIARLESLSITVWRVDLFGQPVGRRLYPPRGRNKCCAERDVTRLAAQLDAETGHDPATRRILVQCGESPLTSFGDRDGNIEHAQPCAAILEPFSSDPTRGGTQLAPQGSC